MNTDIPPSLPLNESIELHAVVGGKSMMLVINPSVIEQQPASSVTPARIRLEGSVVLSGELKGVTALQQTQRDSIERLTAHVKAHCPKFHGGKCEHG